MNNYQTDEQWSFSWVVPAFELIGRAFLTGIVGLGAAIYIVSAAAVQAIKETLSA